MKKIGIRNNSGFSLIELLAVVAITAILSVVTVQIAVNSQLRGAQSEAVAKLRQEGDFILDQMSFAIRNARSVSCVGLDRLDVASKENTTTIYRLDEAQLWANDNPLTSSGLEMSSLTFLCTENDASPGVLVNIEFSLINRAISPPLEQDFRSNVYVRSF
jgi:prepilin-type N-terminal cleavage/methylation domain-containing protein